MTVATLFGGPLDGVLLEVAAGCRRIEAVGMSPLDRSFRVIEYRQAVPGGLFLYRQPGDNLRDQAHAYAAAPLRTFGRIGQRRRARARHVARLLEAADELDRTIQLVKPTPPEDPPGATSET